jgi:hypothetical protein
VEHKLQKKNLRDHIPEATKKKSEYQAKQDSYALIVINSSPDAWILDLGASHHMESIENVLYSIYVFMGPTILMGDDTPVEFIGQGRVELPHRSFENVLHVRKIFVNLLYVYQIMHSGTRIRVEFTLDSVTICDMCDNSTIVVGEVNHQSHLYTFSKFIANSYST